MIPVVITYSWRKSPIVVLCKTEEEALQKLRSLYKEEVYKKKQENPNMYTSSINSNGYYAKVTVFHHHGSDTTEWAIGSLLE